MKSVGRGLALTAAVWLLLAVAPAAAHAQQANGAPAPTTQPGSGSGGGSGVGLPDPGQWAGDLFNQVLINLLQGLSDGLSGAVQQALTGSANVISQTPPALSYDSATVQSLRTPLQAVANVALLLVVMWGGVNLMLHRRLGAAYHGAMELLPRFGPKHPSGLVMKRALFGSNVTRP